MRFLKVLIASKLPFAKYTYMQLTDRIALILVKKFFPFFIFYTTRFLPKNSVACTKFFCILIHPRFKNDLSIIAHEMTHIKQINRTYYAHFILYNVSVSYRYKSELEAYGNQCLFLIFHSHIGLNTVLIDELIDWVTNTLYNELDGKKLYKDKLLIRKEFTKVLIDLLKLHRELIIASSEN